MKLIGTTDPNPQPYEIAHAELSRRAAEEGIVLLKNEGNVLPLDPNRPVALFGGGAVRTIKGGRGSGEVNDRYCVSIFEGMKVAGFSVTTEKWLNEYARIFDGLRENWHSRLMEMGKDMPNGIEFFERCYSQTPFERPGELPICVTQAEVAIYVISRTAGEAADRDLVPGDYFLTDEEKTLLTEIAAAYPHVVVVLNTGGIIDLSFMDEIENIHGLIYLSQPGMEGGNALARVLSGQVSPSGKLSDTWAYRFEDYPSADSYGKGSDTDRVRYSEGIYVGYRYFDTFRVPVRYGFGFGLSYTEFSVKPVEVEQKGNGVKVSVAVTNEGFCAGKEVVQLYVTTPVGEQDKEFRRLAAFGKTQLLERGQEELLELTFDVSALASYHEGTDSWVLEQGEYTVWIGNSLASTAAAAVIVLPERVEMSCKPVCRPQEPMQELKAPARKLTPGYENLMELTLIGVCLVPAEQPRILQEALERAKQLTVSQLLNLVVGDSQIANEAELCYEKPVAVGAGGRILSDVTSDVVFCDGPAGVRLSPSYEVIGGKAKKKSMRDCVENGIFAKPLDCPWEEMYYQRCTSFPVGTMLAQSWNEDLLREVGTAIAEELRLFEASVWLAPGMNIHRNPLCGRNFEYYSEDPLLTGVIAAAVVNGIQSVPGCGATLKHFACNSREDNRMHSDSVISQRAMREIYCKGFEIAVKNARPAVIMTAYNKINGIHCANHYELCTVLAREEWGYDGLFVCDWTSTIQGEACTADGCIKAGCDIIMPGFDSDRKSIVCALERGTLQLEELQACAARVIELSMK